MLTVANIQINDANLLKATVYLCFAQIACLNSISTETRPFIDNMVEDAKNSILSLHMKVEDLAIDNDELDRIFEEFPKEANVAEHTKVNGLAAWNSIYFGFAQDVIVDISKKRTRWSNGCTWICCY